MATEKMVSTYVQYATNLQCMETCWTKTLIQTSTYRCHVKTLAPALVAISNMQMNQSLHFHSWQAHRSKGIVKKKPLEMDSEHLSGSVLQKASHAANGHK